VETAARKRICHHNRKKHEITGGTECLVVKDPASGGSRNYCPECAAEILDRAEEDISALRAQLSL
jgi:hypothetical protein